MILDRRQTLLGLSATFAPAAAQASPGSIEALVAARGFSGALLVRQGARTLHRAGYGLANRPFAVPCRPDTRFRIASITKLFTAVLVMKQAEAGRLDLSAPVSRYLPWYGRGGAGDIPLRTLLNHTSGLPNSNTVESYGQALREGLPIFQQPRTARALVEAFASGPPLRPAGTAFDYNNADYLVLGQVLEAAGGLGFEALLRRDILAPLILTGTGMAAHDRITPRLADSYFRPDPAAEPVGELPVYVENLGAAGAMYSCVDDLAAFADALYGGRLVASTSLEAMLNPGLDDYGLGQWLRRLKTGERRWRTAERYGSFMGIDTLLFRVIEADLTVVALGNVNIEGVGDLAADIARRVLNG